MATATAHSGSSPPRPVVCVPVELDALVLNEALFDANRKSKIAPSVLPDYAALGAGLFQRSDIIDHIDLQTAAPIERNSRITDVAGSGKVRNQRLGVYLHWVLPKAFRAGVVASESARERLDEKRVQIGLPAKEDPATAAPEHPEFRPVPDRWVVCRLLRKGIKRGVRSGPGAPGITAVATFMVESNVLRTTEDFKDGCDIEMEAAPFINVSGRAHEQDNYWIGRKSDLAAWQEQDDGRSTTKFRSPLTVTGSSNPLFADYTPYNTNVFSICDSLAEYDSAELAYFVFGYHARAKQDPFTSELKGKDAPTHNDILQACLMELNDSEVDWRKTGACHTRLVCHGALHNVQWSRGLSMKTPAEELAQHFESTHPVAVGQDTIDALEAYLDIEGDIEEKGLVHELSAFLKSEHESVHARRLAEKDLIKRSFHPVPGGVQWHLNKSSDSPNVTAGAVLGGEDEGLGGPVEQPPLAERPSPVEVTLLKELNTLQGHYDACVRRHSELQFLLFSEWWKHRAEPTAEDADLLDSEDRQGSRVKDITDSVRQLVADIKTLQHASTDGVAGQIGALNQKIERIVRHPKLSGRLKRGVEHAFYTRKDPAMVLLDVKNPWPGPEKLNVRFDTSIPLDKEPDDGALLDAALWEALMAGAKKLPAAIQSAFATLLNEWMLGRSSRDWQNTQAWWPLFAEWEVQYFHIPRDKWSLHEQTEGAISYILSEDRVGDAKGIRDDVRTLTGRSLILPQVSLMLRAHVERLFKQSKPEDFDLKADEQAKLFEKILAEIDDLPFLSINLEGFTDHLTTFVHGSHVAPTAAEGVADGLFPSQVLQLFANSSADVTPYGRYLDFIHHRRDGRDNNFSPFKPATHGQVRLTKLNVVDKFGQVVPALTTVENQDNGYLLPFTSSSVACQSRDPTSEDRYFANTVVENSEGQCEFFQLPPSLNQDARLNAQFVVQNEIQNIQGASIEWRPCLEWENAVWAWLIINFRDAGLQIFRGDGTFVAEVLLRPDRVYWRPQSPFGDDSESDSSGNASEAIPMSLELTDFLAKLRSKVYLETLMDLITDGLENLHPAPSSFAGELPAIFGRPLALVNMAWSLELAQAPLLDQSTSVNLEAAPQADSILDYTFELKIGDPDSYHDGLMGYFTQTPFNSTPKSRPTTYLDFGRMVTDFGEHLDPKKVPADGLLCTSTYPRLKPFYIDPLSYSPETFDRKRNQELHVFAALMDPFSVATGYTGILPPKQLQLPIWTVEKALKQMTPFLSVGPALVPTDIPESQLLSLAAIGAGDASLTPAPVQAETHDPPTIPVQVPGTGEWVWLQPFAEDDDANVEYRIIHAVNAAVDANKLDLRDGPHTAISGFLQLKTPPPSLVAGGPNDVSIDDFGDFFGDASLRLELGGRGSCGGTPGEVVDLSICICRKGGSAATWRRGFAARYSIRLHLPAAKSAKEYQLTLNQPLIIGYSRPRADYWIKASIHDQETALSFPIQVRVPVNITRADLLSPAFSTFDIPTKVTMGQPFEGTVVIRDRWNNVCKGYDDGQLLSFEGLPHKPAIITRQSDYLIQFTPLRSERGVVSVNLDDEPLDSPVYITVLPDVDVTKAISRGSGLCSGMANETVEISVPVVNRQGKGVSDAEITMEVIPTDGARLVLTPKSSTHNQWTATFARPAINYEVRVCVNSRPAPASPFAVATTLEPVVFDIEHIAFALTTAAGPPTVALRMLDSLRRRWRNAVPTIRAAQVRCMRRLDHSDVRIFPLLPDRGDGIYSGQLSLPARTRWRLNIQLVLRDNSLVEFDLPAPVAVTKDGRLDVERSATWAPLRPGDDEREGLDREAVAGILSWSRWEAR